MPLNKYNLLKLLEIKSKIPVETWEKNNFKKADWKNASPYIFCNIGQDGYFELGDIARDWDNKIEVNEIVMMFTKNTPDIFVERCKKTLVEQLQNNIKTIEELYIPKTKHKGWEGNIYKGKLLGGREIVVTLSQPL